jgi:hypothetical protein
VPDFEIKVVVMLNVCGDSRALSVRYSHVSRASHVSDAAPARDGLEERG